MVGGPTPSEVFSKFQKIEFWDERPFLRYDKVIDFILLGWNILKHFGNGWKSNPPPPAPFTSVNKASQT